MTGFSIGDACVISIRQCNRNVTNKNTIYIPQVANPSPTVVSQFHNRWYLICYQKDVLIQFLEAKLFNKNIGNIHKVNTHTAASWFAWTHISSHDSWTNIYFHESLPVTIKFGLQRVLGRVHGIGNNYSYVHNSLICKQHLAWKWPFWSTLWWSGYAENKLIKKAWGLRHQAAELGFRAELL